MLAKGEKNKSDVCIVVAAVCRIRCQSCQKLWSKRQEVTWTVEAQSKSAVRWRKISKGLNHPETEAENSKELKRKLKVLVEIHKTSGSEVKPTRNKRKLRNSVVESEACKQNQNQNQATAAEKPARNRANKARTHVNA